jgi:hypothetical protein
MSPVKKNPTHLTTHPSASIARRMAAMVYDLFLFDAIVMA